MVKRFQRSRPPWASIASFASLFIGCGLLLILFKCGLVGYPEYHSEPCFASHHAGVRIGGLFKRKCLDHRANIFQDTEAKSVLAFNRRSRQASVDRAPSEDERERVQLDLVLRYPHNDELSAWCKPRHQWAHGITTGPCCENRPGSSHALQQVRRI